MAALLTAVLLLRPAMGATAAAVADGTTTEVSPAPSSPAGSSLGTGAIIGIVVGVLVVVLALLIVATLLYRRQKVHQEYLAQHEKFGHNPFGGDTEKEAIRRETLELVTPTRSRSPRSPRMSPFDGMHQAKSANPPPPQSSHTTHADPCNERGRRASARPRPLDLPRREPQQPLGLRGSLRQPGELPRLEPFPVPLGLHVVPVPDSERRSPAGRCCCWISIHAPQRCVTVRRQGGALVPQALTPAHAAVRRERLSHQQEHSALPAVRSVHRRHSTTASSSGAGLPLIRTVRSCSPDVRFGTIGNLP